MQLTPEATQLARTALVDRDSEKEKYNIIKGSLVLPISVTT